MGDVSITEIMGNRKLVERFERSLDIFSRSRRQVRSVALEEEVLGLIEAISETELKSNPIVFDRIAGIRRRLAGPAHARI